MVAIESTLSKNNNANRDAGDKIRLYIGGATLGLLATVLIWVFWAGGAYDSVKAIPEIKKTVEANGNRITALEVKYDNIEKYLIRIDRKLDK